MKYALSSITICSAFALFAACTENGASTTDNVKASGIVNGRVTEEYPEVIRLKIGWGSCTGTAVSKTTVITAAHCVTGVNADDVVHHAAGTNAVDLMVSDETDLAVIVFPANTFSSFAKVATEAPKVGDELVLVGYGQTDYINNNGIDGLKRVGRNRLLAFADRSMGLLRHSYEAGDFLHFRSSIVVDTPVGQDSMTGRGDSGGPLFIKGKLAGVVSFGGIRSHLRYQMVSEPDPSLRHIYEYDTNLASAASKRLLNKAVAEIQAEIH